jgi:NAD(P)-dependent dehydrogenase (short-subunit alcohol dehydrogenase family)
VRQFESALIAAKGAVINIASMYSFFGSPKVPAYGASKAAIHQLTKSLALKYAPHGVRVNAIAPGFVVTEQTKRGRADTVHYDAVISRTPFGRWGQPDDIAGPAMFLASEQAEFVTGQTLVVDGGYSIG